MKQVTGKVLWACVALTIPVCSLAQEQTQTPASTMDIYVFPGKGQDSARQSQDEAACDVWAVSNTGSDPFALKKQEDSNEEHAQAEQQAAKQTGQGPGTRGAVRGAAAGAVIGEIADDDTSKGAAWGAAAGAVRGRRKGAQAQEQAQEQAETQAEQREAATEENWKISRKRSARASKPRSTWSSIDLTSGNQR